MRKVIDILNELPEPYKGQAIENVRNYLGEKELNRQTTSSIGWILINGFEWKKTPKGQGFKYWNDLCNSL